jgi:hypothetical protein
MNRKEQLAFTRLEIENAELRASNSRHIEVYRDQSIELIDLRTNLAMVRRFAEELYAETNLHG